MNAPAEQTDALSPPPSAPPPDAEVRLADAHGAPRPESEPEEQRAFDWLTDVALPACIIGLLGSFLYYLVELRGLVGGGASGQLRWVCFFFTFGIVLITRIRMTLGRGLIALPYIIGLGFAVALYLYVFTMSSGSLLGRSVAFGRFFDLMFNYALVAVLWYAAHRLTTECTADESMMESGDRGLLTDLAARPHGPRAPGVDDRRRAKHPGRLVMWFSLVAIAVFALGHRAATAVYGRSSKFAFECMVAYLFFALTLLALTTLTSLRTRVRRRQLAVSKGLVPAWILVAAAAACLVLLIAGQLPREGAAGPTAVARLIGEGGEGLDEGRTIDFPVGGVRERAEPSRWRRGEGPAPTSGGAERPSASEGARAEAAREGTAGSQAGEGAAAPGMEGPDKSGEGEGRGMSETPGKEPAPGLSFNWWWLLLLLLLLLLILCLIIRYRKQIAAWFRRMKSRLRVPEWVTIWAQRAKAFLARVLAWLRALGWGRRLAADAHGLDRDAVRDPFADRDLSDKPPAEKIMHVYHAMLAYADLIGCPRAPDQTPLEYLRDLPHPLASFTGEARDLTRLYVQARYSPFPVTDEQVSRLRAIWNALQSRIDEALSLAPATR